MCIKKVIISLFILFSVGASSYAIQFPEPDGYINDYAQIINQADKANLDQIVSNLKRDTGAELAIVAINTTAPIDIDSYGLQLMNKWGIGEKWEDNGVLIILAKKERKIRIVAGYGLEDVIQSSTYEKIIDQKAIPLLIKEKYSQAILNLTQTVDRDIRKSIASKSSKGVTAEVKDVPFDDLLEGIDRDPSYINAYLELSERYNIRKEYQESIAILNKAMQHAKTKYQIANIYYCLANTYYQSTNYKEAILNAKKAGKHYPSVHINLLGGIGDSYYKLGDYDLAAAQYKKVIALSPNNGPAYLSLANCYTNKKNYKDAEACYKLAIKNCRIDSNLIEKESFAHNNLGVCYELQKKYTKAKEEFGLALEINKDYKDAQNNLERVETVLTEAAKIKEQKAEAARAKSVSSADLNKKKTIYIYNHSDGVTRGQVSRSDSVFDYTYDWTIISYGETNNYTVTFYGGSPTFISPNSPSMPMYETESGLVIRNMEGRDDIHGAKGSILFNMWKATLKDFNKWKK